MCTAIQGSNISKGEYTSIITCQVPIMSNSQCPRAIVCLPFQYKEVISKFHLHRGCPCVIWSFILQETKLLYLLPCLSYPSIKRLWSRMQQYFIQISEKILHFYLWSATTCYKLHSRKQTHTDWSTNNAVISVLDLKIISNSWKWSSLPFRYLCCPIKPQVLVSSQLGILFQNIQDNDELGED